MNPLLAERPLSASPSDVPLTSRSAGDLAMLIRTRQVSASQVVEAHLDRIAEIDPICNAFTVVVCDEARREAQAADRRLMTTGSPVGALHGVPVAIKDYTPTRGILTTRGSRAFATWVPTEDAPVVERLKAAGAIIVGKTTTAELAHSSFTRSQLWGVTRNPYALDRTAGGSSGGSAVAVATGCVPLAEGTDSGGSLRIPASCCGVVGFKPSRGRIPAHSSANDFDGLVHHGPLCRDPRDARLFLEVCEGPDERDPLSLPRISENLDGPRALSSLRIAVSMDLDYCLIDPDIANVFTSSIDRLIHAGVTVVPVALGWSKEVNDAWLSCWSVAFATEHGTRIEQLGDDCEPSLHRLCERGRATTAVELKTAELVQTRAWEQLRQAMAGVDALLCPTLARQVPPAEGFDDDDWGQLDARGRVRTLDMTSGFNLMGFCPVISVPNGIDEQGLPTGVQLVGHRYRDHALLDVAMTMDPVLAAHSAGV